jgi:nifR3 family TIM-barrel protein
MKIGNIEINGYAALAPMASVGDYAFRTVCKKMGAAYVVGEMASCKGLLFDNEKTKVLLRVTEEEHPMAVQLFGDNPEDMGRAASVSAQYGADIIDINMGCPVPKIAGSGSGAALMKDIKKAEKIVSAVVKNSSVPVTVKFRRGWDEKTENAVDFAKMAEANGAAAVTVHCRTKEEMYRFPVDISIIERVKNAVGIAVIGNGGIRCGADAERMYKETGCDLVMIGTSALGNPFIFREINEYMEKGEVSPVSVEEKIDMLITQAELAISDKGETQAIREMRKHAMWYFSGLRCAASLKKEAGYMKTLSELKEICEKAIILQK